MELFFWQNIISPHQAPFLRALAEQGHGVTVVATEAMTADRVALGWQVPDLGRAEVVINPDVKQIQELIANGGQDAIHTMAGARWTPLGNEALRCCRRLDRRLGILTEAPDPRGLAGLLRWGKYTVERLGHGSHYNFILAMGEMGVRWFQQCGYPTKKVFPFSYVTEPVPLLHSSDSAKVTVLLFVGRFIPLKGVDLLLRAFAALASHAAELRLLGEGPAQAQLQHLAHELGIANRITWLAKTDAAGVQAEMARADVTLLPSRKDGWGAVVNESLMVGTPVICSTACGAAELIRQPWLGNVFRSGSVAGLTEALQGWIEQGRRTQEERRRIQAWANCLSGKSVAQYFVGILNHIYSGAPRPEPPWRLPSLTTQRPADDSSELRPLISDL